MTQTLPENQEPPKFISPFKAWLDNQNPEQKTKAPKVVSKQTNLNYYELLSGLSGFVQAVRQYKYQTGEVHIADILEYYDLMQASNTKLVNNLKIETNPSANLPIVELMTAHKSKGLEFDYVFILNFDHSSWFTAKGYNPKLKFPKTYQLEAEQDDIDDRLRLLYVAMTRAKKQLYLLKYNLDSKNKPTEIIPYIEINYRQVSGLENDNLQHIQQVYNRVNHLLPITLSQKEFFKPILGDYKMSITHLNNFLDVTRGGPGHFFMVNLIRFPQSKNKSASYGTSMHEAIRFYYQHYKENKKTASLEDVLNQFDFNLKQQGLNKLDYQNALLQGQKAQATRPKQT